MIRRENNSDEPLRRKRPPAKGASPRVSSREGSRRPDASGSSRIKRSTRGASSVPSSVRRAGCPSVSAGDGSSMPSGARRADRLSALDGGAPRSSSREGEAAQAGDYSRAGAAERLKTKRRLDVKAHDNKIIFVGTAVFVAIILVVSLVMSWNLWWRYDDAADIQGTWTVEGSSNKVKITDSALYLTDTLFYDYTLDTENKRITFTFEDKKGEGAYSFSDDRNTLTIAEENTSTSDDTNPSIYTTLVRSNNDGS